LTATHLLASISYPSTPTHPSWIHVGSRRALRWKHQSLVRVPLAEARNQTRGLEIPCFCLATAAGATCSRRLQGGSSTSTCPPISRSSQEYCPTLTSTSNPILYTTPTPIP